MFLFMFTKLFVTFLLVVVVVLSNGKREEVGGKAEGKMDGL